jgi:hypothetical protein
VRKPLARFPKQKTAIAISRTDSYSTILWSSFLMNNPKPKSGGGRAQVRAPIATRNQVPMVPVSMAKQSKSLEERLYVRFKELDPDAVRVTRFRNGTVIEEVFLNDSNGVGHWVSSVKAEEALSYKRHLDQIFRAVLRAKVRLGRVITEDEFHKLSKEDKRILLMSQKEYNSFRALQGGKGPQGPQTGPGGPASPDGLRAWARTLQPEIEGAFLEIYQEGLVWFKAN